VVAPVVSHPAEVAGKLARPAPPSRSRPTLMKLLLDTHVFIWMHGDPARLSSRARKLLTDASSELHLSVVVAWEMGIKLARERLTLPESLAEYVTSRARQARMSLLSIDLVHVLEAVALPPHHADPFDRMLVGQARAESLVLLTADPLIARYDVEIVRA
jgi:PIN domain nuclease of toxin-antitoxin system